MSYYYLLNAKHNLYVAMMCTKYHLVVEEERTGNMNVTQRAEQQMARYFLVKVETRCVFGTPGRLRKIDCSKEMTRRLGTHFLFECH